ncbi:hypothetical protein [Magnetovibrio blakemorei]|uniref:Tyr recombinase domain-containing protein n=1 Tax=Magnetovibrio blakemorei TaxID=28181 RepID=A0A1E5Q4J6_9PROT|nr:hypothetical protein [Magnetovibrio blakemorei]OEJ64947.1 hypothetical protein BEN30_15885 [Magnetovibrio blakemorei]
MSLSNEVIMPRFAGTPWTNPSKEIEVYQEPNDKGVASFHYRLNVAGQKGRPNRSMAAEFRYSPAHYHRLKKKYPINDPCTPPDEIMELAQRILSRAKDDISKKKKYLSSKKTPTLTVAADKFILKMEEDVEKGLIGQHKLTRYKGVLKRYVIDYPLFNRKIDEIDTHDMIEWQLWRDDYWVDGPGMDIDAIEVERNKKVILRTITDSERRPPAQQTKVKEKSYINAVFEWASLPPRRWCNGKIIWKANIDRVNTTPVKKTAHFTSQEWEDFSAKAAKYIETTKSNTPRGRMFYYRRHLCFMFAQLMRAYGLRVAECYSLVGNEVYQVQENGRAVYHLAIGSVKRQDSKIHQREIGPAQDQIDNANAIIKALPVIYKEAYGIVLTPATPLWMQEDGSQVKSFYRVFKTMLEQCGYLFDRHGDKRNLTSVRHATFTHEILHGTNSMAVIAAWGGTSEDELRKTYNHAFKARESTQSRPSAFA